MRSLSTYLNNDHRRILLIDRNRTKQDLRATILRNYEIEVHTASSITDAAALSRAHFYDLVLLEAQESSEETEAACARIRQTNPRQRIGLLVGPPVFVRELGGTQRGPRRRKATSISKISLTRSLGRTIENPDVPTSSPLASLPQWQEMIRKLVTDWYVGPRALLGLSNLRGWTAGA
jgi:CheY-like chemotaxis protein